MGRLRRAFTVYEEMLPDNAEAAAERVLSAHASNPEKTAALLDSPAATLLRDPMAFPV